MQQRNTTVTLYPYLTFFLNCHFWTPIFFLYFLASFTVSQVIFLEAVYYVTISLLEVPSGYLSDKFNRKWILVLAILSLICSSFFFFLGTFFSFFLIGQIFMACGFALISGTDTALHYEALKRTHRKGEYALRESHASGLALLAGAVSAFCGGMTGIYSLSMAYLFTLFSLLIALILVLSMEDHRDKQSKTLLLTFHRQTSTLFSKAIRSKLRPVFLYAIFITVLIHIPYEFYQPYIKNLSISDTLQDSQITGFHLTLAMLIGAWSTRFLPTLMKHFSPWSLLLSVASLQVILILFMACSFQMWILVLLLLRAIPKGISAPLINAMVTPQLKDGERSTFLSLQSLCGRILFGLVLLLMTMISHFNTAPIQTSLWLAAAISVLLLLWLFTEKNILVLDEKE